MKTFFGVAAISTALIVAVACGRSEDPKTSETRTTSASQTVRGARASCDRTRESGTCEEYKSGTSFGLEKSLCEGFKGKFAMTPCEARGMVGSCRIGDAQTGEVKRYHESRFSAESAKADCESEIVKGTFERS